LSIRFKQQGQDSEPLVIDLLDCSEDGISGDESDDIEEEEEGEGKKVLLGMPKVQDDSDLGIMPITINIVPSPFSSWTVEPENPDFDL
jgi:hypothetical protein